TGKTGRKMTENTPTKKDKPRPRRVGVEPRREERGCAMTNNGSEYLTEGEKLNLILAKLSEVEARLAKLEARRTYKHPRPDRDRHSDLWLDYRDAAEMMRRPADYFRVRDGLGEYEYWPQIERWQPDGRGTRLYVRREHVEAWIERSRTPPPCPVNMEMKGIGYESLLPEVRRKGYDKLIRSLGLSAPTTKPNTRATNA